MKARLVTLLAAGAAAFGVAGVAVEPASAHSVDRDHQHGWNTALMFDPVVQCSSYGMGSVNVAAPDFMTTPGGSRTVYFRAIVERYDFSTGTWVAATWNGTRWVLLGVSDWYYTVASASGPVFGWRELSTNRYGPVRVSFYVQPGHFYRFRIQYHWGYDGVQHEDVTSYCKVG